MKKKYISTTKGCSSKSVLEQFSSCDGDANFVFG